MKHTLAQCKSHKQRERILAIQPCPIRSSKKIKIMDPNEMKEMNTKAEQMFADLNDGKEVNEKEMNKAIFFLLFNLKTQFSNYSAANDKKIESLSKQVSTLQSRIAQLECLVTAKDIIFQNIPMHPDAVDHKETVSQTKEQIQDFFDDIKIVLKHYEMPNVYRLKWKDDQRKGGAPFVIVRFPYVKNVRELFSSVKLEKNNSEKYKRVFISNSIPPSLKEQFDLANTKAKSLRDSKKWSAKVELLDGKIVLKTRAKSSGSNIWSTVPQDKWKSES